MSDEHQRVLKAISSKKFTSPNRIANRLGMNLALVKDICRNLTQDGVVVMSGNFLFKKSPQEISNGS